MIAIFGAGKMGEALLAGLLRSGREASSVVAVERYEARAAELRDRYGVEVGPSAGVVKGADTIIIAVKPQDMAAALAEISPLVGPSQLVISIAAGITTAFLEEGLPDAVPVVRVMPNTPAVVAEAMSVLSAGRHASAGHMTVARELFEAVGKVVVVPENLQDAATALSGSGPAYVYYVVESMVEAGILLGVPRQTALELVTQAVFGAATMLRDSGEHPVILREAVTSPAGTTVAAIRQLESHGVRAAFYDAIEAARDRGRQLGGA
jgi:pyrroline-5-carboxylate reductase